MLGCVGICSFLYLFVLPLPDDAAVAAVAVCHVALLHGHLLQPAGHHVGLLVLVVVHVVVAQGPGAGAGVGAGPVARTRTRTWHHGRVSMVA